MPASGCLRSWASNSPRFGHDCDRSSEKSKASGSTFTSGSGWARLSARLRYSTLAARLFSGDCVRSLSTASKPLARHCDGSCASTNNRVGGASLEPRRVVHRRLAGAASDAFPGAELQLARRVVAAVADDAAVVEDRPHLVAVGDAARRSDRCPIEAGGVGSPVAMVERVLGQRCATGDAGGDQCQSRAAHDAPRSQVTGMLTRRLFASAHAPCGTPECAPGSRAQPERGATNNPASARASSSASTCSMASISRCICAAGSACGA